MRILCFTNLFPNRVRPNKGLFNWRSFRHLQKHAELRVISPVPWVDELVGRRQGKASPISSQWIDCNGVSAMYPRFYYTPGFLRNGHGRFMQASVQASFRRAVQEFRPDIVFACWAYPDGWAATRFAREFQLPVALKVHGSDLLCLDETPSKRPGTVQALQAASAVVAVSSDLGRRAVDLGAARDRVHVVYTGTDTDLFSRGSRALARRELGLPEAGFRLLLVGNLLPVKSIDTFIEACRELTGRGLEFSADIVGEGPLCGRLQQQIHELGLTGIVQLRGAKPQQDLPNWYRAADAVVLSSRSEGVPNVLMEAAACGTPFVATAVGGVTEIQHLSPIPLVPPGNPPALAAAIASTLSDLKAGRGAVAVGKVPSAIDAAEQNMTIFTRVIEEQRGAAPE